MKVNIYITADQANSQHDILQLGSVITVHIFPYDVITHPCFIGVLTKTLLKFGHMELADFFVNVITDLWSNNE